MRRLFSLFVAWQVFVFRSCLFAQDGGDGYPTRDQGFWQTLVMISIAMLFFYFILWRPEQKRRKALEQQRQTLKKGDKVTAMGIIGTVTRVQDQTVILRMYDGNRIECLKAAITDVASGSEEDAKRIEREDKEF